MKHGKKDPIIKRVPRFYVFYDPGNMHGGGGVNITQELGTKSFSLKVIGFEINQTCNTSEIVKILRRR